MAAAFAAAAAAGSTGSPHIPKICEKFQTPESWEPTTVFVLESSCCCGMPGGRNVCLFCLRTCHAHDSHEDAICLLRPQDYTSTVFSSAPVFRCSCECGRASAPTWDACLDFTAHVSSHELSSSPVPPSRADAASKGARQVTLDRFFGRRPLDFRATSFESGARDEAATFEARYPVFKPLRDIRVDGWDGDRLRDTCKVAVQSALEQDNSLREIYASLLKLPSLVDWVEAVQDHALSTFMIAKQHVRGRSHFVWRCQFDGNEIDVESFRSQKISRHLTTTAHKSALQSEVDRTSREAASMRAASAVSESMARPVDERELQYYYEQLGCGIGPYKAFSSDAHRAWFSDAKKLQAKEKNEDFVPIRWSGKSKMYELVRTQLLKMELTKLKSELRPPFALAFDSITVHRRSRLVVMVLFADSEINVHLRYLGAVTMEKKVASVVASSVVALVDRVGIDPKHVVSISMDGENTNLSDHMMFALNGIHSQFPNAIIIPCYTHMLNNASAHLDVPLAERLTVAFETLTTAKERSVATRLLQACLPPKSPRELPRIASHRFYKRLMLQKAIMKSFLEALLTLSNHVELYASDDAEPPARARKRMKLVDATAHAVPEAAASREPTFLYRLKPANEGPAGQRHEELLQLLGNKPLPGSLQALLHLVNNEPGVVGALDKAIQCLTPYADLAFRLGALCAAPVAEHLLSLSNEVRLFENDEPAIIPMNVYIDARLCSLHEMPTREVRLSKPPPSPTANQREAYSSSRLILRSLRPLDPFGLLEDLRSEDGVRVTPLSILETLRGSKLLKFLGGLSSSSDAALARDLKLSRYIEIVDADEPACVDDNKRAEMARQWWATGPGCDPELAQLRQLYAMACVLLPSTMPLENSFAALRRNRIPQQHIAKQELFETCVTIAQNEATRKRVGAVAVDGAVRLARDIDLRRFALELSSELAGLELGADNPATFDDDDDVSSFDDDVDSSQ